MIKIIASWLSAAAYTKILYFREYFDNFYEFFFVLL